MFITLLSYLGDEPEKSLEIYRQAPVLYKKLLVYHYIDGIAYNQWKGTSEAEELKKSIWRKSSYTFLNVEEYRRVSQMFSEVGIGCFPYKGVDLIVNGIYPDESWRGMTDLDIIVPHDRFAEAKKMLLADGYEPSSYHDPAHAEETFHKAHIAIDLHWNIFPYFRHPLPPAFIFEEEKWSMEKRLYFLILHGTINRFHKVIWLMDALFILRNHPIDWNIINSWSAMHKTKHLLQQFHNVRLSLLGEQKPNIITRLYWRAWNEGKRTRNDGR